MNEFNKYPDLIETMQAYSSFGASEIQPEINKDNFFINTKAKFTMISDELLNDVPDYTSPLPKHKYELFIDSGIPFYDFSSAYWYTKDGVYRFSDHWGKVNNCQWDIIINDKYDNNRIYVHNSIYKLGFCQWQDFSNLPI